MMLPEASNTKKGFPLKKAMLGIKNSGVVLIVLLLAIILTLVSPRFLTILNITNILRQISIVGIISCAVTILMITGNLDLSIGSLLTLTSFVCASMTQYSLLLAIVLPIIVGAAFGLINGMLVGVFKLNSFIVTLAMMSIIQILALFYSGSHYMTPADIGFFKQIGQGTIGSVMPIPVVILIVVTAVFHYVMQKTVFGRQVVALGGNRVCARFSGISVTRITVIAFMLVGLTTGLASVVFCSRIMSAQTTGGSGFEFDTITACVLGGVSLQGGKGNVIYSVLGAFVVGMILNGFILIGIPINYQYIVRGVILITAVAIDKSGKAEA